MEPDMAADIPAYTAADMMADTQRLTQSGYTAAAGSAGCRTGRQQAADIRKMKAGEGSG